MKASVTFLLFMMVVNSAPTLADQSSTEVKEYKSLTCALQTTQPFQSHVKGTIDLRSLSPNVPTVLGLEKPDGGSFSGFAYAYREEGEDVFLHLQLRVDGKPVKGLLFKHVPTDPFFKVKVVHDLGEEKELTLICFAKRW